jgi:formylglycine-generating enzyme required for sulfatase activity
MKKLTLAVLCFISAGNFTLANTIRGIDIDFVNIGHVGNAGDSRINNQAIPRYCGSVSYDYRIGKCEITNAQWGTFTAVAGSPTGNPATAYDQSAQFTGAQQPTNKVSWYEAAQFCNYLTSGNKNLGAYQLGIDGSITIDRASAKSTYGTIYVLPTEDEWYKAAYFKPDGSGYSTFANGTDVGPSESEACYGQNLPYTGPWNVGSGLIEQNGTFDMMGNVYEWNERLFTGNCRGFRGGSYRDAYDTYVSSGFNDYYLPLQEYNNIGFRIVEIPEPASIVLIGLGGVMVRRKRD